jgi:cytochrome c553
MELYVKGERPHDEEAIGGVLNKLKEEDLQDILAYVTSIQERQ